MTDADPPATHIRKYELRDRSSVREICRRTAFRNRGSDAVFEDRELFADYWTRYYTDFEPGSAFVAERNGKVVAYLLGALDSRRFIRIMAWRIVPVIALRLAWRFSIGRYRQPRSRRFLRWLVTRSWREAPRVPIRRFPAHFHVDILPEHYHQGLLSRLAFEFLDYAQQRGCSRLHLQLIETGHPGIFRSFADEYERGHPRLIEFASEKATVLGKEVLGIRRTMINRCYGFRIEDYRSFNRWAAEHHGF